MMTDNKMGRFIIYGAGGIGGVVGGHLLMAGYNVVLIGRPAHMQAVQQKGLTLIKPDQTHTLKLTAVTSPAEAKLTSNDVILLTMKGQNTAAAMHDLKSVIKDIPVFCLQNGVRNEEIAASFFPRVYSVRVNIGAVYMNDGEVVCRRDPPGWLIMSVYPQGIDELVEDVGAALRRAGFYVLVTPDAMPYKWGKLMTNLGNAVGAITNAGFKESHDITQAAQEEARRILSVTGISWLSEDQIKEEWSDFMAPPRAALNTPEQSSTWQSLGRQQGTVETEFLNGEIVRVARKAGLSAPINETITRLTAEMAARKEKPGKYSAAELRRILGLS
jgi:2-dehydropantoate 2-reductase